MWPYYPDLLETPVPRYTSYPTAADFGELPTSALAQAIGEASGDISLYLHIPFCEKICFYCGCNTGAAGRRQRVQSYLASLHAEIETVATLLPRDARVRRVAFGGGSPNAIEPSELLDLVDALHRNFWLDQTEWSIELDPRSMNSIWGEAIAEAGFTRASMGVQTFAAHCQEAIGRVQDDQMICRSIDWLRSAGVTSLNFDLMYGLPGQTREDLADSLEYTALLGADRIAVFGYAHVPHIVPRQKMIPTDELPGRDERFAMASQAFEYLMEKGYKEVGFDHFALPGDPMAEAARTGTLRRNFQGFTDDQSDVLIGLGASAISGFPGLIAQNEKNNGRYRMMASQGRLTATVGIKRSSEDQLRARVIEELLCRGRARLSPCLLISHAQEFEPFLKRGLMTLSGLDLSITPSGLPYARVIASKFDTFRAAAKQAFSSAI
ncbi:oxygen-independent coproporphyrinogen III oxidase [Erythrobacter sp. KY5]|uniref:oxygen-independent coproporphyrinogen III oxidase n=1 Tax=Erythrobacter sp. KY5 TaxID=2011159 RepID=UPI000DBF2E0C|nr:oxygen-independent coproporphyrinogen III oxidase [Erythrobacter sp. KY5]AWW73781.1 oxygen-independent coproporphyrinogen III oxidase [Erythrobacter sp. KY5]